MSPLLHHCQIAVRIAVICMEINRIFFVSFLTSCTFVCQIVFLLIAPSQPDQGHYGNDAVSCSTFRSMPRKSQENARGQTNFNACSERFPRTSDPTQIVLNLKAQPSVEQRLMMRFLQTSTSAFPTFFHHPYQGIFFN